MDIDTLSVFVTPEAAANLIIQARQAGLSDKVRLVVPPGVANNAYVKTGVLISTRN